MFYISPGAATYYPSYAFALDLKEVQRSDHGLEMTKYGSGSDWTDLRMTDVDGSNSKKDYRDINYNARTDGTFGYWN